MNQTQHRLLLLCGLSALPFASLFAQSANTANDDAVLLSQFTVEAASTHGYVASESTTGTRVATKIADLPFNVSVLTSDFLKDFDIFDMTGPDMAYVSNLSGVDSQGNSNMRGFNATFYLWNGFYRLGLLDRSDVDRIEVIKGNNAAIYGQTSPAGILNVTTKQPTLKELEQFTYTIGSYNLKRMEGDFNFPLIYGPNFTLADRISFGGMDRTYDTPYAWLHQRLFSDGLLVKIGDKTRILVKTEWSKRTGNPVSGEQMFVFNSATKAYTGQLAPIAAGLFSQDGPNAIANRELTSVNAIVEHDFNDAVTLRMAAYGYARHAYNWHNGISTDWDPALNEVVGISTKPLSDNLNEDGGAAQADLLIHWKMLNGAVDNRTLVTFDYSQNWRYRVQLQAPSTFSFVSVENPLAPNYAFPDINVFTVPTRKDKVRWDTDGIFIRDQASLLNNKLLLFAGLRFDNVEYNLNFGNQLSTKAPFPVSKAGQVQHYFDDALDPQLGYNFKLTKNIALYSSYSESFFPNAQNAKLGNPPLGDQRGRGFDYGIRGDFLNSRLIFTLGGFYINQTGVKATVTEPDGTQDTVPAGRQNSKGLEFDANYQVTNGLFLQAGYGYANARVTNNGDDVIAVGRHPQGIPVDNAFAVVRYQIPFLKGLSANFGGTYTGVSYPETNASTLAEARIQLPSYTVCILGATYQWESKIAGVKLDQSVRLSVKNLFDKKFSDTNLNIGDSRAFYLSYTITH